MVQSIAMYKKNNSIKHQTFVYTQLNDQTCLFLTIQFSISQQSQMVPCIAMYKHQSFVYSQLNDQTFLFLTIQFNISHLFTHCYMIKQFYF